MSASRDETGRSPASPAQAGGDVVDIRPLMAEFPTGIAVVTALGEGARPWGMTCTSLCSVTLSPPTLIVCLREGGPTLAAVRYGGAFALNLLHQGARSTAELFASGSPDRFSRVTWTLPPNASGPYLVEGAHIIADCRVVHVYGIGDHAVVAGEVTNVTRQCVSRPLMYGRRRYAAWPAELAVVPTQLG